MFGVDQQSQRFLDETIEDNVARCRHARPTARPDPRTVKAVEQKKPVAKTKEEKKRKSIRDFFRRKAAETS